MALPHLEATLNPTVPSARTTMKAVVFKGPGEVCLEERPVPKVLEREDAVVKVALSGLCGSELHVYRGSQPSGAGFIMGHEFTGTIVEVGDNVRKFKVGDRVISPFTTSCGECMYCTLGFTARCQKGKLFGCEKLDGAQAEYVRVPLADGTLVATPEGLDDKVAVLMADIFPTGFFAARTALTNLPPPPHPVTIVLLGLGPVGLCALLSLLHLTRLPTSPFYRPPTAQTTIIAIDSNPLRRSHATSLGVTALPPFTGQAPYTHPALPPHGADAVIDCVGHPLALRSAFDLVRPFGAIASVGVYNQTHSIPWTAGEAYDKNVRVVMGRCPVRGVFEDALVALGEVQKVIFDVRREVNP
ncbi:alcohol dehydrogenase [Peziza echinospora]|nr:alcohol dehydrogenase [Peziza echinospora]